MASVHVSDKIKFSPRNLAFLLYKAHNQDETQEFLNAYLGCLVSDEDKADLYAQVVESNGSYESIVDIVTVWAE